MAKKKTQSKKATKEDIAVKNLKGFIRRGANVASKGNIPTGHFNLDFAIHHGLLPEQVDFSNFDYDPSEPLGLPRGKIVELFGEEGAGKSSLAHRVVGYAQKMGLDCAWIDTENSYSESLARLNGVDVESVLYSDMSNEDDENKTYAAEDIFNAIIELCKSDAKVIVIDSVANMVPKTRLEADAEKQTVGIMARLMSENMGKIVSHAAKYGVLIIFINQLREKIGVLFGNNETTPGGRALKHNASIRLQVTKRKSKDANVYIEDENGNDVLIGCRAYIRLVKNRFAKPCLDSIDATIYYEPYFPDLEDMLFDTGRQLKIISVRKGVFSWGDHKVEGKVNFIQFVKDNNLQTPLYSDIKAKADETGVLLPPEITTWASENTNLDEPNKEVEVEEETNEEVEE